MFARTERLTLRPGWPEDAAALVRAIAHESVVSKLAQVPWPYALGDAKAFLAREKKQDQPTCLVFAHQPDAVRLVGAVGIHLDDAGRYELGYWITPGAWGRGYATEAARALVANARHTLRLKQLVSGHFVDNPASGRVLTKLGFRPTGKVVQRLSQARGRKVGCATFELDLTECDGCDAPNDGRMAA